MRSVFACFSIVATLIVSLSLTTFAMADAHVMVSSIAKDSYTKKKFPDGKPQPETYVVMPGTYFAGATVDKSIDKMPFRKLAGYLARQLAHQEYWPSRNPNEADLLLVIHWGVTVPNVTSSELLAHTSSTIDTSNTHDGLAQRIENENKDPNVSDAGSISGLGIASNINADYAADAMRQENDGNEAASVQGNIAQMLGYGSTLRKHSHDLLTTVTEETLRRTLDEERYFVIVKAYDLKTWKKGVANKSIWTIRLNISSLGNNFDTAMTRMSKAGADYFGRTTNEVSTIKPKENNGRVDIAPLIILGEVK